MFLFLAFLSLVDLGVDNFEVLEHSLLQWSLWLLVFALISTGVGGMLGNRFADWGLSTPWFYSALVLVLTASQVFAFELACLTTETIQSISTYAQADALESQIAGTYIGLCGVGYLLLGQAIRHRWPSQSIGYNLTLLGAGPVFVYIGLAVIYLEWPQGWVLLDLFGRGLPPPALLAVAASLGTVLLAFTMRLRLFITIGLLGTLCFVVLVGNTHLESVVEWPIALMAVGVALIVLFSLADRCYVAHQPGVKI